MALLLLLLLEGAGEARPPAPMMASPPLEEEEAPTLPLVLPAAAVAAFVEEEDGPGVSAAQMDSSSSLEGSKMVSLPCTLRTERVKLFFKSFCVGFAIGFFTFMCFLKLEGWVYDLSHPLAWQL